VSRNSRSDGSSEVSELNQTISELKANNRILKKDKDRLITELQTLKKSFNTSKLYIDERLDDIPVEDVVRYFARKKAGKLEDLDGNTSAKDRTLKKFQKWISTKSKENE
jgi:cell division protein FtsB